LGSGNRGSGVQGSGVQGSRVQGFKVQLGRRPVKFTRLGRETSFIEKEILAMKFHMRIN
jgi:hypothetical protein